MVAPRPLLSNAVSKTSRKAWEFLGERLVRMTAAQT
jgi:hypothetical protein